MGIQSNRSLHSSIRKKVLLGALFLSVFIFIIFQLHAFTKTDTAPQKQEHFSQLASTTSSYIPGLPSRLIIPSIAIDAAVEEVGLEESQNILAVPKSFVNVGWYKDGPRPGMPGSAVIDGHLNGKNVPKAVFFKLGALSVGESVFVVDEKNHRLEFVVTKVRTFNYLDSTEEVFEPSSERRLNLITCAGDWLPSERLFDKRTVVFTRFVQEVL